MENSRTESLLNAKAICMGINLLRIAHSTTSENSKLKC